MPRQIKSSNSTMIVDQEKVLETLRRYQRRLLDHPDVTSVGIGYRIKDGKQTDELSIQCTVDQKLAPEALAEKERTALPASLQAEDGTDIPVDVLQRNYRPSYQITGPSEKEDEKNYKEMRRTFQNPMFPGISVSNVNGTAGTIGAFVFDVKTGESLLLSNWHVLDNGGKKGDVIVQPGPHDNSATERNRCGSLLRSHLGIAGDCAVARITQREFDASIVELNRIPLRMAKPEIGDNVVKSGRTTGVTYGTVSRTDVIVKLSYGNKIGVKEIGGFEIRANIKKIPSYGEISMSGDSGSLWMADVPSDHKDADVVLGLHFAGDVGSDISIESEHAIACCITSVAKKLDFSFDPPTKSISEESELWREVFGRLIKLEAMISKNEKDCTCQEPNKLNITKPLETVPESGVPFHGNWCGPSHGGGQPIDELDAACMRHDQCYDQNGYFDCQCNRNLLNEIDSLIANGRLNVSTTAKALLIKGWFAATPCARYIKIGGRTIPLPGTV